MHRYYRHRKKLITGLYAYLNRKIGVILKENFDKATAEVIIDEIRKHYEEAMEKLPYIGGCRNSYTPIMVVNGWFVCAFRAMKENGLDDDVAMYMIYTTMGKLLKKVPSFTDGIINRIVFSRISLGFFKRKSAKSQKRKYKGDFVFETDPVRWETGNSDKIMRIVFSDCGVHKYYDAVGCPGLKKYCNFFDPMYGARFKLGLDASHTFAHGCDECVISISNRKKTKTPENIVEMIENAEQKLAGIKKK